MLYRLLSELHHGDAGRFARTEKGSVAAEEQAYRTPWQRDYDRVLHSPSFRRLQGKTQLFPGLETDFFRSRLTHSVEVAQIGKSIVLRINSTHPFFDASPIIPEIVEAAALAHDLGHPPFGHNGEEALDALMRHAGGFEGNAQTLRIVARLERYRKSTSAGVCGFSSNGDEERHGLNLTFRTMAAILKYDNLIPLTRNSEQITKGYYHSERHVLSASRHRFLPAPLKVALNIRMPYNGHS